MVAWIGVIFHVPTTYLATSPHPRSGHDRLLRSDREPHRRDLLHLPTARRTTPPLSSGTLPPPPATAWMDGWRRTRPRGTARSPAASSRHDTAPRCSWRWRGGRAPAPPSPRSCGCGGGGLAAAVASYRIVAMRQILQEKRLENSNNDSISKCNGSAAGGIVAG